MAIVDYGEEKRGGKEVKSIAWMCLSIRSKENHTYGNKTVMN